MPSPHLGVQRLPTTRHWKPFSTVLQSPEQPSPLLVLPSSHSSFPSRILSPHASGYWATQPAVLVPGHPEDPAAPPVEVGWVVMISTPPPPLVPAVPRPPLPVPPVPSVPSIAALVQAIPANARTVAKPIAARW